MALSFGLLANTLASAFGNRGTPKSDKQYAYGDLTFALSAGNSLDSYGRRYDGGWIDIELLNELPLPQQTGRKLDEITFTGRWYGVQADTAEKKLVALRDDPKPRTLVRGDGRNCGQWTLGGFEIRGSQMIYNGTCMVVDVTISLREFPNRKGVSI